MFLQDLLDYIKENANNLSDLISVADIEKLDKGDPWRKTLVRELRTKYADEAIEADQASVFE